MSDDPTTDQERSERRARHADQRDHLRPIFFFAQWRDEWVKGINGRRSSARRKPTLANNTLPNFRFIHDFFGEFSGRISNRCHSKSVKARLVFRVTQNFYDGCVDR